MPSLQNFFSCGQQGLGVRPTDSQVGVRVVVFWRGAAGRGWRVIHGLMRQKKFRPSLLNFRKILFSGKGLGELRHGKLGFLNFESEKSLFDPFFFGLGSAGCLGPPGKGQGRLWAFIGVVLWGFWLGSGGE